jgi:5-formyltetrahydrofolate cyclo-ligase
VASGDIPSQKKSLRAAMRRLLANPPAGDTQAVDSWLEANPAARTIAAFAALSGEIELMDVIARHPDRRWVFPRVAGDELCFHAMENPVVDLITGAFGVREPSPALPIVEIAEIDAFFCPGLAFDARGGRLGRGKGFYDRMLATARPDALKIGICHQAARVDDTFPEPHDIAMDEVIFC